MAIAIREALGEQRLSWLRSLSRIQIHGSMALAHASPSSLRRAPVPDASDAELSSTYTPLGRPTVVYAHIHRAFVRNVSGMVVVNTRSVGLSYEGDRRAAYLLMDDSKLERPRVEYHVDTEIKALAVCGLPHTAWVARSLQLAAPQVPCAN